MVQIGDKSLCVYTTCMHACMHTHPPIHTHRGWIQLNDICQCSSRCNLVHLINKSLTIALRYSCPSTRLSAKVISAFSLYSTLLFSDESNNSACHNSMKIFTKFSHSIPTSILALPINSQSSRTPIAAAINSQLLVFAISPRA